MMKKLRQQLKDDNWRLLVGVVMFVALCLMAGIIPAMIARWPWTGLALMAYVAVMTALIMWMGDDDDEKRV